MRSFMEFLVLKEGLTKGDKVKLTKAGAQRTFYPIKNLTGTIVGEPFIDPTITNPLYKFPKVQVLFPDYSKKPVEIMVHELEPSTAVRNLKK